MAVDVREVAFTIPAGTPQTNPATLAVDFPPRKVTQINVRIPAGPNGTMGFAVGSSGVPVIPVGKGQWIVADDDYLQWPLTDFWDSGSWELFGYNTGTFPHTVYFTFLCELPDTPTALPLLPSPNVSLAGSVQVGSSGQPVDPAPIAIQPFRPPSQIPTAAASFAVPATSGVPIEALPNTPGG